MRTDIGSHLSATILSLALKEAGLPYNNAFPNYKTTLHSFSKRHATLIVVSIARWETRKTYKYESRLYN